MHLIKKPERPRWRPFVSSLIGQNYESDWDHFLNLKKQPFKYLSCQFGG